ncbi:epoxyqueuosine reductase QueH [Desulfovibrio desulfuricans]|uniref:Epoxyqueuosine reductase QueH n=1 Tax=Desulfovibrio desulfuricans TaxID=876 RepID=A0A4P7UFK7_DESDE|nr:epoxyqueuosine reductase QueH [Desulfovibrio desulfuricans]QCC84736.1 epoxyqueuosine reductase QueH [Desulfovibrio desulfuricans]
MSGNNGSPVTTGIQAAGVEAPAALSAARTAADPAPAPAETRPTATADNSLLLHVCCGPCAVMPITRLLDEGFSVTAWFMNPNIQPLAEYLRRREAAAQCAERLGVPIIFADETWNITAWLRAVAGRDEPPARCAYCCESRMEAAFAFARQKGFAWVSSSLLYSRYQPHEVIKSAGERLAAQPDAPGFAYRDFRTDWQEGIDRSKAMQLYRQPYCGCVYSEAERYHKQLLRCING